MKLSEYHHSSSLGGNIFPFRLFCILSETDVFTFPYDKPMKAGTCIPLRYYKTLVNILRFAYNIATVRMNLGAHDLCCALFPQSTCFEQLAFLEVRNHHRLKH